MAEPPEKRVARMRSDDQGQSTLLDADGARAAFAELPENLWTLEAPPDAEIHAKNFLQTRVCQ